MTVQVRPVVGTLCEIYFYIYVVCKRVAVWHHNLPDMTPELTLSTTLVDAQGRIFHSLPINAMWKLLHTVTVQGDTKVETWLVAACEEWAEIGATLMSHLWFYFIWFLCDVVKSKSFSHKVTSYCTHTGILEVMYYFMYIVVAWVSWFVYYGWIEYLLYFKVIILLLVLHHCFT